MRTWAVGDEVMPKICVVCGEDCSGRPRTKDPNGRYFCTPCYSDVRAKAKAKGRGGEGAPPPGIMADAPDAPDAPDPADADDGDFLADIIGDSVSASAAATFACPGCGTSIHSGAVICTSCGTDLRSGVSAATAVAVVKPPRVRGDAIWPWPVGIISILIGTIGMLFYGAAIALEINTGLTRGVKPALMSMGSAGLFFSLSLWILTAGIGTLRRRPTVVSYLRRWAITKLIVETLITVAVVALIMSVDEQGLQERRIAGQPQPTTLPEGVVLYVIALYLCGIVWPTFVLIWFGRAAVKDEVEAWA